MAKTIKHKSTIDEDAEEQASGQGQLHLLKLCVGADSISDQEEWIQQVLAEKAKRGLPVEQTHTTRMVPKRVDELLAGGSLYWVIKGQIAARQTLLDIRPVSYTHLTLPTKA